MAPSAVASQSGRSSRQNKAATPVQNASPSRHGARGGSATLQPTPTARRSARTTSRHNDQPKDAISNPALPEIQTRQSYAYGSSKAPQLPEQLHARGTMSMQQVADQMNTDIHKAQMNLEVAAENQILPGTRIPAQEQKPQAQVAELQQSQTRRRQTTPVSQTTDVQKQKRTAAWASSLDESQLDDIEEESPLQDTPETRRTDPSSFPSGVFDHSYAYERGIRAPRIQLQQRQNPSRKALESIYEHTGYYITSLKNFGGSVGASAKSWFSLLGKTVANTLFDIPESRLTTALVKLLVMAAIIALMHIPFCYMYRNAICDITSVSQVSQILERFCGACQTSYSGSWNMTASDHSNIHKITASLNSINSRINSLESKLSNRIDSKYSHMQAEMNLLRKQQNDLTGLLENLGASSDNDIASPLMPQINFFAPANGAIVNPWLTSPTRSRVQSLPIRVALGVAGLKRYDANGPATALLPWQDVGDCWCASASTSGQDSVRLGVEVKELIYPTELVVEHPPTGATLSPDTAPREIELWADVGHFSSEQRKTLGIDNMRVDGAGVKDPLSSKDAKVFAKYASVEYDASARNTNHVQRFKLDLNAFRDMKYSAKTFVVRARTNHGADYSCIYRIRLHGVSVAENVRQSKFTKDWGEDQGFDNDI